MTGDIFKLFKNSIERVGIKKTDSGKFGSSVVYSCTIDAIVKRRNGSTEEVNESQDFKTNTTIHFRATDKNYIEEGNFVLIDGKWRAIDHFDDGKNFDKGVSRFIKTYLGDLIEDAGGDPTW